jgi:hypothetical protein
MLEFELKSETFEVPKNTGINGFLLAIKSILALPKVQGVHIDARGKVTYERFVPKEDALELGPTINFETLMPYACVRNGVIKEISSNEKTPTLTIARMFQAASRERLYPIAWVTGANPTLWDWFRVCAGIEMENLEEFYGLPLLADRYVDDYVLILATAYGRSTSIVDAQKSFKIVMPQRRTEVENALSSDSRGEVRNTLPGNLGAVPALGVRSGAQPGDSNGKAGASGPGDRGGSPG